MIKTDRYVQTEAAGMLYRLIPVTEEIIRCVIGKEEIKGNDSLIIEKKDIRQLSLQQRKTKKSWN